MVLIKEPCNNIIKSDASGKNESLYPFTTLKNFYGHIFVYVPDRRNSLCKTCYMYIIFCNSA